MEQEYQPPQMSLMAYFSSLKDPRIERNKLYPFHEVIVITILAHGIPHHDVYRGRCTA
ncbi:MAG: transposase family protein [Treponema sp.]|jgi:hypothetical protein|nr:transposase family protein [Treponema sp.]